MSKASHLVFQPEDSGIALGQDKYTADIDACLPQLQCGRCGFNGCAPYAQAIAAGTAPINRCAPGGQATIDALAAVCEVPTLVPEPQTEHPVTWNNQVAFVHESACIGCTLCLRACPTDAIVGAIQQMHTIIAEDCTGCRLCEPVCPTQCIEIVQRETVTAPTWNPNSASDKQQAESSRTRYHAHLARLQESKALAQQKQMRQEIKESLQRVKQRRANSTLKTDEQNGETNDT
ncbi:MAG: RnfABCDGE type electron transport complex subunit B [Pseudomonadota bacterium]